MGKWYAEKGRRMTPSERSTKWAVHNKEKKAQTKRAHSLKTLYGMTVEEWEILFDSQDRSCAICSTTEFGKRRPNVDHCHNSTRVRGILCNKCNQGLGLFNDDPELLKKASKYIRKFNG